MTLTVRGTALVGAVVGLVVCVAVVVSVLLVAVGVLAAGPGPDASVSARPDPQGVYILGGLGFLLGATICAGSLRTVVALRGQPFRDTDPT